MHPHDLRFYRRQFPKTRRRWLNQVSRTFALSIKVLPRSMRWIVGHSYLLCRLLDTVEDAPHLTVREKRKALDIAIRSIRSPADLKQSDACFLHLSLNPHFTQGEKILLSNSHFIFEGLDSFDPEIQKIIEKWTTEMARGMQEYSFGPESKNRQLASLADLDRYIYFVAGTVGRLLTDLICLKRFGISPRRQQILRNQAVTFGKALQLVNIIKDSRSDEAEGRCYIPRELLASHHLSTRDFFHSRQREKILPVYHQLIRQACQHLDGASIYIQALPARHYRYRLGCMWTVLLAHKTLRGLTHHLEDFIAGADIFKIPRKEVKKLILSSLPGAFFNGPFRRQVQRLRLPSPAGSR